MKNWKLNRTVQCAKCPWKCSTNPHDIPNNYDVEKHKNLDNTIAKDLDWDSIKPNIVMACHHSKEGKEEYCIGWLNHQLNEGNNIKMRIKMMFCENPNFKTFGRQHKKFEDTLPVCSIKK
jgi:hypothetical protein